MPERISASSSEGDHQQLVLGLPMKPEELGTIGLVETESAVHYMLSGCVKPHREHQTIPQGPTSLPPKYFSTPTANGQSAPRTGSARGVGRRGEPHTEHGLGTSFQH